MTRKWANMDARARKQQRIRALHPTRWATEELRDLRRGRGEWRYVGWAEIRGKRGSWWRKR